MRPEETYTVVFNPCSMFEIQPKTMNEGTKLVRLIATNRDSSKLYLNSFYCFIEPNQIWSKDTTEYFPNASSGYCRYAVSSFNMCTKDIDAIMDDNKEIKNCNGITLYFSGQEMYSLYYDYQTKIMTAKFDGYYDEKLNVKIGKTPD